VPITKNGSNEIVYTAPERGDLFSQTGVAKNGNFAVCANDDVLKQIKLDPAGQATNTTATIASNSAQTGNIVITLPASSGSLLSSGGGAIGETSGGTGQTAYTTGDTLFASATNTLSKLPIGTPGQIAYSDSTGVPIWGDYSDITRYVTFYEDFLTNQILLGLNTGGTSSSAGVRGAPSTAAHPGAIRLVTGISTTGFADAYGSNVDDVLKLGGGTAKFETIVNLSALSDGTNTYTAQIGITTPAYNDNLSITAGIYFTYTHSTNSGKWVLNCTKASTTTTSDTGIAVAGATWVRLGFVLNSAGTSVQAYINGVAAGTPITTNIPAATTALNFQWLIIKSAGTGSFNLDIDAYKFQIALASTR